MSENRTPARTFADFEHNTDLSWIDISSEQYRTYVFSDAEIEIIAPIALNVSRSGGHRIFDNSGRSHYIPKGWRHLSWKALPDQPHFVA